LKPQHRRWKKVKQEEEELKELDAWWKDAFIQNGTFI